MYLPKTESIPGDDSCSAGVLSGFLNELTTIGRARPGGVARGRGRPPHLQTMILRNSSWRAARRGSPAPLEFRGYLSCYDST